LLIPKGTDRREPNGVIDAQVHRHDVVRRVGNVEGPGEQGCRLRLGSDGDAEDPPPVHKERVHDGELIVLERVVCDRRDERVAGRRIPAASGAGTRWSGAAHTGCVHALLELDPIPGEVSNLAHGYQLTADARVRRLVA
jgi:hypothetical protein